MSDITYKWTDRIFIMILENHGWSETEDMNMVKYISKNGIVFTNYHGTMHPSGPNYRSLISGLPWSSNEFDGVKRPNIGDYVPAYQYDYAGSPAERHNPFLDMKSTKAKLHLPFDSSTITSSAPYTFLKGIHYLGMDDQNDAHSASLDIADQNVMKAIKDWESLKTGAYRTDMFFVVFDEAFGLEYVTNRVFAGLLMQNSSLGGGYIVDQLMNHYNVARFLYDNFNIPMNPSANSDAKMYAGEPLWKSAHRPTSSDPDNSFWKRILRWI